MYLFWSQSQDSSHYVAQIHTHHLFPVGYVKGRQPIQDQSSVLGTGILNNPRSNLNGRSSNYPNYPQFIQLSPKHQSGEFRHSWEVKLCNIIQGSLKGESGLFFDPVLTLWGGSHIDRHVWGRVIVPSDLAQSSRISSELKYSLSYLPTEQHENECIHDINHHDFIICTFFIAWSIATINYDYRYYKICMHVESRILSVLRKLKTHAFYVHVLQKQTLGLWIFLTIFKSHT